MPKDSTEFIDTDLLDSQKTGFAALTGSTSGSMNRPPTREEIEAMVSEKQLKLAELKRAQEELERERAGLEELRRRQNEFATGKEEMINHLTRGIGLLEQQELKMRAEAESMARTLEDFREMIAKVRVLNDGSWSQDNFQSELTSALTTLENARMEWNSARLKFPVLSGQVAETDAPQKQQQFLPANAGFVELCKIGFALTWPLVALGFAILGLVLLRH
jgi:DNA repair exonuclease SbcCD ATPase subunit